MRPDNFDAAHLWDMRRYAREVAEFVAGKTWKNYQNERILRAAVERCVLVVGEAAYKVSAEFQAAHPEVPWRQIIAQRHRLVHEYGKIDDEKIWGVANQHIPVLLSLLEHLIPPAPPNPLPEPDQDSPGDPPSA